MKPPLLRVPTKKNACDKKHCVESVRIQSFYGLHFSALGLNTEIHSVNICIQSKYEKIQTTKTRTSFTLSKAGNLLFLFAYYHSASLHLFVLRSICLELFSKKCSKKFFLKKTLTLEAV